MTMTDRPKLGAMFAAPATERPAALAGLLAADPEPTDRPHPAPAAGHDANRSTASDRSAGKTRSSRGRATSASIPESPTLSISLRNKIVPVVLDASVLTELRAFASRTEQTQGNVALRAIEAHAEELQVHWRTPTAPPAGLFAITAQLHRRAEPGVQTQLRISPQDAVTLDNIASEWGAPSRSALVNEALRRYVKNAPQELAEPITN
jgi:hypothetical protein